MPIFEYRCSKCGNKFEEIVHGDRDRTMPCPRCGNASTEKLMSVIGGISMGNGSAPSCGASCPGASTCGSGGGCCPHGG